MAKPTTPTTTKETTTGKPEAASAAPKADGAAAPAAAAAPAPAPAPEHRYWLGFKYSIPGSALTFVMTKVHEKPGITHAELKKAVVAGYKRKVAGESDETYAQSLINYARKNEHILTTDTNYNKELPVRPATAPKAASNGLSDTAKVILEKVSSAGNNSLTTTFSREKLTELTGKPAASLVRTLSKLVKDGLLTEATVEGAKVFSLAQKGLDALKAAAAAPAPAAGASPTPAAPATSAPAE